jgi:hypothetical protein
MIPLWNFGAAARREYLCWHEPEWRAADRRAGVRRIDVALRGMALADHATVRRYIGGTGAMRQAVDHRIGRASEDNKPRSIDIRLIWLRGTSHRFPSIFTGIKPV